MSRESAELLESYHATTLRQMAENGGVDLRGRTDRRALLSRMEDDFFTAERIHRSYANLTEIERAALNHLLLHPNPVPTTRFKRELIRAELAEEAPPPPEQKYGNRYYVGGAAYARRVYNGSLSDLNSQVFEDLMARLTWHGLVFSRGPGADSSATPFKVQFHPADVLFIPEVVRSALPTPDPLIDGALEWPAEQVRVGDPNLFLRDLYLYWDFVRTNEVTLIQSGYVGKRSLVAVNQILLNSDPKVADIRQEPQAPYLYLLRQLLSGLNLIFSKTGRLHTGGSKGKIAPKFWNSPQSEQVQACLSQWLKQIDGGPELAGNDAEEGRTIAQARRLLSQAILGFTPNRWYEVTDVWDSLVMANPNFLYVMHEKIENDNYFGYFGGKYYYRDTSTLLVRLQELEQLFIRRTVDTILFPLGLVDLGMGKGEDSSNWQVFRLTERGQQILRAAFAPARINDSQPLQVSPGRDMGQVVVQPNFQILAMGPVSLATLAQLDQFAQRERADRAVFEYRLTRESVYQAQQQGLSAQAITHFLTQITGMELPQNLRRSLEEWAAHHERIVFRSNATLLQTSSPELMQRLAAIPEIHRLMARELTPQVALIHARKEDALVQGLRNQGHLPAMSGPDPASANHTIYLDAHGEIRPVFAEPSLYLRGRLSAVAQEESNGRWRLTAKSVHRAGGTQRKVQALVAELEQLSRGPLPEELIAQLRQWGNYYGRIRSDTLHLLEFPNQTILAELCAHPRLASLITPFANAGRPLAVVQESQLERVQEILTELGAQVSQGIALA